MNFLKILSDLRVQDVLDILFLTVIAYHLHIWFRGTKAFKALVGLLVLGVAFTLAQTWGLFLTTWVFQILWQVLIILLIILFQSEIRQVLERVNPLKAIGFRKQPDPGKWIPGFATGVFTLAKSKIGVLIIIERTDRVDEWVTGGHPLSGDPDPEVLMSIFQKESPLHDGAIVISDGQIRIVSCYLPLSSTEGLPKSWGTRHRAALGLTEKCDAVVAVVSEERGDVTLTRGRDIIKVENQEKLSQLVLEAVTPLIPKKETGLKRIPSYLLHEWRVKLVSLCLVTLLWLLLAGQQDFEVTFRVPLEVKNIPAKMEVLEPVKPMVKITARGLRKDASTLSDRNVHAEVDLTMARFGRRIFLIARDQISLPNDRIQVIRIEPAQVAFEFKEE